MTDFSALMAIADRAISATLGEAATYSAPAGGSVPCRVVRLGGGEVRPVGGVRLVAEDITAHVSRSDVTPEIGGTIAIGTEMWMVEAIEPVPDDPMQLTWSLRLSWGAMVRWLFVTGSGRSQNPPKHGPLLATGVAGESVVTITVDPYPDIVGRVVPGDVLRIGGVDYAVTADVEAVRDVLTAVPIDRALAASYSAEPVTPIWSTERQVRAAVADYQAHEIMGGVVAGDRRLVVRLTDMPQDPAPGHRVEVAGQEFRVIHAARVHGASGQAVAWDCQVRR